MGVPETFYMTAIACSQVNVALLSGSSPNSQVGSQIKVENLRRHATDRHARCWLLQNQIAGHLSLLDPVEAQNFSIEFCKLFDREIFSCSVPVSKNIQEDAFATTSDPWKCLRSQIRGKDDGQHLKLVEKVLFASLNFGPSPLFLPELCNRPTSLLGLPKPVAGPPWASLRAVLLSFLYVYFNWIFEKS